MSDQLPSSPDFASTIMNACIPFSYPLPLPGFGLPNLTLRLGDQWALVLGLTPALKLLGHMTCSKPQFPHLSAEVIKWEDSKGVQLAQFWSYLLTHSQSPSFRTSLLQPMSCSATRGTLPKQDAFSNLCAQHLEWLPAAPEARPQEKPTLGPFTSDPH